MGLKQLRSLWFVVVLFCVGAAFGVDSYTVEPAPADSFRSIPRELAPSLDPSGVRLVSHLARKNVAVCEVWWRMAVETQPNAGPNSNIVYGNLRTGELLGVVRYLVPMEDFQHHMVKPGFYSMRYAQLDQDDSEQAISPFRDFAILSPIWADHQASSPVPLEELIKRSRFVTHENEAAVLSLVPVNHAYKKYPSAVSDDRGFCVIQALLTASQGARDRQIPLALILVRPPYENEGS